LDTGGRFLYLRLDAAGSEPLIWSPTGSPVRKTLDRYECRHGMGYTIIHSEVAGIQADIRYFIPIGTSLEVWDLTVTNHRREHASLGVFPAVEWCLWDALDDTTNFQRNYSIGEVEVDGSVIYHKTEYRERRDHFAYLACSEMPVGYDTQRDAFLGGNNGWETPAAVQAGRLSGSLAHGWQPIAAQHVSLSLHPGEQHRIILLLGYHENPPEEKYDPPGSQSINKKSVLPVIRKYLQPKAVDAAFTEVRAYWSDLLERLQVSTPDEHVNRMVNTWNAYQVMITFNMSRSASYFESGIGRGMGFRDSNQDLLAFVQLDPTRARQRLLDLAATQLPNGGAYHQYQPLTRRGNNDVGSQFNDDPLWLVMATAAYLKETGDWGILEEGAPYDNQPGSEMTLLDHLQKAMQYTLDRLGPHGLPLIGRADWNDCLNLNCFSSLPGQSFQTTTNKDGKVAESVFIAALFVLVGREMVSICTHAGLDDKAGFFASAVEKMESIIETVGWDGGWWRRAYDDAGVVVGSHENVEGRIFIEPQGMCIMAGLGLKNGHAAQALEAVAANLATPHGIVLQHPAYSRYYLNLGEISSYPPGYKENAGIFCHTNPWIMIAEARLGNGERAFDYYQRINPSRRGQISEIHRCEPYVYAQMIAGRDAPTHGEAKNSWLTGTAAWNYIAITQWILGIRPTYDGLEISPVMPESWQGFRVTRLFRGVRFEITVERVGPGISVALEIDGKVVIGALVPVPVDGKRIVQVRALVGTP
jgi:cellobiose phosphorylase